jgi:ribosomal-protein-alanine N-acetyltransferase
MPSEKEPLVELNKVEIKTDNLILTPITEKHAQSIFEEFTDDITRYMYPKPSESIDGVKNFISSSLQGLEDGTNLQLVILKKATLEFLGCAGLHNVGRRDPELGLWIKKSAHGNSFGLEAITGIIKWARANIVFEYLKYPVDKRNIASRRIPERNDGIIRNEYKQLNEKGFELDEVEYWIYK